MLRMDDDQICTLSETDLCSLGEDELADWHRHKGVRVVFHRSRYWRESPPGFFTPVHLLARLTAWEARKPALFCWGFRASLAEEDKAAANTTIAINALPTLRTYEERSLSSNRRYELRRCHKQVKIVALKGPRLLEDQGYEIYLSARQRTGFGKAWGRQEYVESVRAIFRTGKIVVLAGVINDRLGGYLVGYAVNDVAYIESLVLASEALKTHIGTGLTFEFVQICRRSSHVRELVHGTPARDEKLTWYKKSMGFVVKEVVALLYISPSVHRAARWLAPRRLERFWSP